MHNFRFNTACSALFMIIIICYSIYQLNKTTYKKISVPETIEGVIIGNSHAYRIILDNENIFYLNTPNAHTKQKVKQSQYAEHKFHNLNFMIINIAPIEFYRVETTTPSYDNDLLYRENPLKLLKYFEKIIISTPSRIINILKSTPIEVPYFIRNGRKIFPCSHKMCRSEMDWLRENHFKNFYLPTNKQYLLNLQKIKKMLSEIKPGIRKIIITMPHNYRYIHHFSEEIKSKNVPNLQDFQKNIQDLPDSCYINLLNYPLDDKYFWDGDHINEMGAQKIQPLITKRVNECLNHTSE